MALLARCWQPPELSALKLVTSVKLQPVLYVTAPHAAAGYFAYMAFASLPGSQFWDRLLLLATEPKQRAKQSRDKGLTFMQTVPFK